jgi:hypothetical protein
LTSATCFGTSSGGISGGFSPDGCGSGAPQLAGELHERRAG